MATDWVTRDRMSNQNSVCIMHSEYTCWISDSVTDAEPHDMKILTWIPGNPGNPLLEISMKQFQFCKNKLHFFKILSLFNKIHKFWWFSASLKAWLFITSLIVSAAKTKAMHQHRVGHDFKCFYFRMLVTDIISWWHPYDVYVKR